ncbi:MAG: SLBB domain-containing protein [Armatimonadetes bacterium]|nr:SLBB domain-containing protein [Armatimonadota bacterium]
MKARLALFAPVALMVLPCVGICATDTAPQPASAVQTEPAAYVLAPDDAVSINVANFANLSTQAVVLPDGKITVPLLGSISVEGKTTTELARLLTDEWNKYVVDPVVTVALTQRRKASVLVYGFANKGGEVEFRPMLHISEALALAGGAAINGDLQKVTLTHRNGDKKVLDLTKPETLPGTDRDVVLQEGDIIYIPERRTQVNVIGEVNRPGSFDYRDDITVLDALGAAGGVRDSADLSAATLERGGKEQPLDLEALLRRGEMTPNIKLEPGDRILVPEIQNRTYIFGAVAKPGWYPFKPGDRVLDALNASGIAQNADYRNVNLIKIDKTEKTAAVQTVNLENFLKKGDVTANAALAPGDVVFVSEKKRAFKLQDALGILSSISILDNTFRILTGGRRY